VLGEGGAGGSDLHLDAAVFTTLRAERFAFALIIWFIAVFARILDLGQPLAIAVGHSVVVLLAVLFLGGWFFSTRSTDATGQPVGFSKAFGLSGLTFGLMFATGGVLFLLANVLFPLQCAKP